MAPSEELVQIPKLEIKLVVLRGADRDHGKRAGALDDRGKPQRQRGGELRRVPHSVELREMLGPDVAGGNHQGPKEIALSTLIDSDVSFHGIQSVPKRLVDERRLFGAHGQGCPCYVRIRNK